MPGTIGYSILIDRDASTFELWVDYSIDPYFDPETGESFYDTAWAVGFLGGGTGGYGSDSQAVPLYLGFSPGEQVMDGVLSFSATNTFSGDSVSMEWRILNAGMALQAKTLVGGNGLDIVVGGSGADSLGGAGGRDHLDGGAGADTLDGGDGHDLLDGGAGADRLVGGAGDDVYRVNTSNDVVVEVDGGGNDTVFATASYTIGAFVEALVLVDAARSGTGNAQANRIDGNALDNLLSGLDGDDQLHGDDGNDTLRGGAGDDLLDGGQGSNRLVGGQGDDHYVVGHGVDAVVEFAGEGTDEVRVVGRASYTLGAALENLTHIGEETGFRGVGNGLANVLTGSWRVDVLEGLAGDDTLDGGQGNDVLLGGKGADHLVGGGGSDAASYANAASGVTVDLGAGQGTRGEALGDSFASIERLVGSSYNDQLTGDEGANILDGGAGRDVLRGGAGDDWLEGGAGADSLDGGAGHDGVRYAASAGAVHVDLEAQTAWGGDAEGDTLAGFDRAQGGRAADTLVGNSHDNMLFGGAGADTLDGAAGNDTLRGGAGADSLQGGAGVDTLDYGGSGSGVQVDLGALAATGGDASGDAFSGFENLAGSSMGDVLRGNASANVLSGRSGNDTLHGGDGQDTVSGGAGADSMDGGAGRDTLSYAGAGSWVTVMLAEGMAFGDEGQGDRFTGFENILGGAAGDALYGDAAANRIDGGAGNDVISGGGGSDVLRGGAGDDAFYVGPADGVVRVLDFTAGGAEDRVVVDMGAAYDSFAEIMAVATTSGQDTVITFGPSPQLVLVGVDSSSLSEADFSFSE